MPWNRPHVAFFGATIRNSQRNNHIETDCKKRKKKIPPEDVVITGSQELWLATGRIRCSMFVRKRGEMKRFYIYRYADNLEGCGVWMSEKGILLFEEALAWMLFHGNTLGDWARGRRGQSYYPSRVMDKTMVIAFRKFPTFYRAGLQTLIRMGCPGHILVVRHCKGGGNKSEDFKDHIEASWYDDVEEAHEKGYEEPEVHLLTDQMCRQIFVSLSQLSWCGASLTDGRSDPAR